MISKAHLLYACILLSNLTCYAAHAQVVPTDTYTQLYVSIPTLNLPSDDSKKKQAFNAIINSLGFGNQTRKINVSVKVKIGDVNLPEQSLLSYGYNSGSNSLESDISRDGISFPLKKLNANDRIFVTLVYRDATSAQYNTGAIASVITRLIPASSLINEANKPLIQGVFDLSSATWNAMASQSVSETQNTELSPYTLGRETATLKLSGRGGVAFGTVKLSLYSTFSLLHTAVIVKDFDPKGKKRADSEMYTQLQSQVAGVTQNFSGVLRSQPSYTHLIGEPSSRSIQEFCFAAREVNNQSGLTVTDSTYITYGLLSDAGLWKNPRRLEWFKDCFNSAEITVLKLQNNILAPEVDEKTVQTTRINMPRHLFAFGCWMTDMSGPNCSINAPDPNNILTSILGDNLRLDVDSAFLSTTPLGVHDTMSKASVIELLSKTASSFSCFQEGMLVKSRDGRLFRFEGELLAGKITAININPASDATMTCTGR